MRAAKAIEVTVGGRAMGGTGLRPGGTGLRPVSEPSQALQLSGRTDGDQIVFFDVPAGEAADDLIGRIVPVRVVEAVGLSLLGALA
jgi:hypothetical protein